MRGILALQTKKLHLNCVAPFTVGLLTHIPGRGKMCQSGSRRTGLALGPLPGSLLDDLNVTGSRYDGSIEAATLCLQLLPATQALKCSWGTMSSFSSSPHSSGTLLSQNTSGSSAFNSGASAEGAQYFDLTLGRLCLLPVLRCRRWLARRACASGPAGCCLTLVSGHSGAGVTHLTSGRPMPPRNKSRLNTDYGARMTPYVRQVDAPEKQLQIGHALACGS